MRNDDPVSSDETILRRVRPGQTIERNDYGLTPQSRALRPRKDEKYPSWTRARVTSAKRLLQIEATKGADMSGWSVAATEVRTIRDLGLDVLSDPIEEDPGHCHIVPTNAQPFTKPIWQELARQTRIIKVEL